MGNAGGETAVSPTVARAPFVAHGWMLGWLGPDDGAMGLLVSTRASSDVFAPSSFLTANPYENHFKRALRTETSR